MASSAALTTTRFSPLASAVGAAVLLMCSTGAHAEFVLNWSQQSADPAFFPGQNVTGCTQPPCIWHEDPGVTLQNQTPFLYERVTLDGNTYYHMIIGDGVEDGLPSVERFGQEVFIQVGGNNNLFTGAGLPGTEGAAGPLANASSSSRGFADGINTDGGSQVDPLRQDNAFTGNSTGNPNRVQMRQLVIDGELTVDFVKDTFLDKPNIRNEIETSEIRSLFLMDSTGNRYDTMETPSAVTNSLELLDPDVPESAASFDAAQAAGASITAGRYTYEPTTGAVGTNFGGAGGDYQYFDGGSNLNPDWGSFFDHREANPWAFPASRPTP